MSAYTGKDITTDDLFAIGAEIITAERRVNLRYGLTSQDDTLPARFLRSGTVRPDEEQVVDAARRCDYYQAMAGTRMACPQLSGSVLLRLCTSADQTSEASRPDVFTARSPCPRLTPGIGPIISYIVTHS